MQRVLTIAVRRFASEAKGAQDYAASEKLWRNLSLFVCLPAMIICTINSYIAEKEHHEHFQRPTFVKYDYLKIQTKKYPWGDGQRTLFHNPKVNALPTGYEDEQ